MIPSQVEIELSAAYREETACYARALKTADRLLLTIPQGTNPANFVAQIVEELQQVARLEQGIQTSKDRWQQVGGRSGPDLGEARAQTAAMILELQDKMAQAAALARARQHSLAPVLDTFIRGRQMRHAYEQSQPARPPSA